MWTLDAVLEATGAEIVRGTPPPGVSRIEIDSRKVQPGDLFIALLGSERDGHDFIPDAVRRGARVVLVHREVSGVGAACVLQVQDTARALERWAVYARKRYPRVVGVTGSAGKTTTKYLLGHLLEPFEDVGVSPGNLNSTTGVPLSLILHALSPPRVWIQEIGINRVGEMARIREILDPTDVLILNAFPAHLEGFGDVATVAREKCESARNLPPGGVAVTRRDQPHLWKALREVLPPGVSLITYGEKHADILVQGVRYQPEGMRFQLRLTGNKLRVLECTVPRVLPWLPYNTAACTALLLGWGLDPGAVPERLVDFQPPPHRGRILTLPHLNLVIFDDTYNSNPEAARTAARFFQAHPQRRHCLVLGDMLELGPRSETYHLDLATTMDWKNIHLFVGVGPLMTKLAEKLRTCRLEGLEIHACPDVHAAAEILPSRIRPGDAWLLKGSRGLALDQLLEGFLALETPPESRHVV